MGVGSSAVVRRRVGAAGVALAVLAGGVGSLVVAPTVALASSSTLVPITSDGDMVVDGAHQRIFLSDPWAGKVVAVRYDGAVIGSVDKLPGVRSLALSADAKQLYAAAPNADAIVSIDTDTVTETARYSTGKGTMPTYLAVAGGMVWFGYGDAAAGAIGSLDPAGGESAVTLRQDSGWYSAPLLAATPASSGIVAAVDPYTTSGGIRIFDVSAGTANRTASSDALPGIAEDLAFTPDGSRLLTASDGGDIRSWQTSDLQPSSTYLAGRGTNAVAIAPDGRLAAGTDSWETPDVHVFLPGSTTPVREFDFPNTSSTTGSDSLVDGGLAWEPGGERLFAISYAYPDVHRLLVLTDPTMSEPKLTVSVPAKSARAKQLTVSGTLTASLPLPAGTPVAVTRTDPESPNGTPLTTRTIDTNGRFSFTDAPASGGKVIYRVAYAGDATHLPASALGTVAIPLDATTLTLDRNGKVFPYAAKVSFTARLGKTYKNRIVEIWADPAGADQKNRLVKKATANASGVLSTTLALTRVTTVTAIYRGDTRTAARTVKSVAYAKVRVSTAVSRHYTTRKIGSIRYYVFHKTKNPLFTTTMTPAKGRSQLLTFEYYYNGKWRSGSADYFPLSSKGKSAVTLTGTHETNLRMRVRPAYVRGGSGDSLNYTTYGSWKYFVFTK